MSLLYQCHQILYLHHVFQVVKDSVGGIYRQSHHGATHGGRLFVGSPDQEQDGNAGTQRHKIYTCSGHQISVIPYVLLVWIVLRPALKYFGVLGSKS